MILGLLINSCTMDNYNSPNSHFFGSVIDSGTNEPIPQDLINGSQIEYTELGYENPIIQYLRFKTDGSFENKLMFAGTYEVKAVRGNFFDVPTSTIKISEETEYHFTTLPYIRINDVSITTNADKSKVIATFKLQQVAENPVASIVLFADRNSNVSNSIHTFSVQTSVNSIVDPQKVFTLEIGTNNMIKGKGYYFRIGALISGISQAKHNYSIPVLLNL